MSIKKEGLKVLVGEPWPEGVEVHVEETPPPRDPGDPRNAVVIGTAIFLGLLLGAFTVYGMVNHSEAMLDKVFELVRYGLLLLWGFVFGRFTAKSRPP